MNSIRHKRRVTGRPRRARTTKPIGVRYRPRLERLESRRLLAELSGLITSNLFFSDPADEVRFVGNTRIAQGATITIAPNVNVRISLGSMVTVDGRLRFDNAAPLRMEDFNGGVQTGVSVSGTGRLELVNTDVLRLSFNGGGTTRINIASGGTFAASDSVIDIDQLILDAGSVISNGAVPLLTGNEFDLPVTVPFQHLQNASLLSGNRSFEDIILLAGVLPQGETLDLNLIGTQGTASLRYVLRNGFSIEQNAVLTVHQGVSTLLGLVQTISVDGTLRFDNAAPLRMEDFNGGVQTGVSVSGTGRLELVNTDVLRLSFNGGGTTRINIASGGTFAASDSVIDIDQLILDAGSVISNGAVPLLTGNEFDLPVTLPFQHLQNASLLSGNRSFEDIVLLAGVLPQGETLDLNLIGTQDTASLRYVLRNGFAIEQNAVLTVHPGVSTLLGLVQTISVDGTLRFDNAAPLRMEDINSGVLTGVFVSGTGRLELVNTDVLRSSSDGFSTTRIIVASGGTFAASESIIDIDQVIVGAGSVSATFVEFDTNVFLGPGSTGTIVNSRFLGDLELDGLTETTIASNFFNAANVVRSTQDTFGTIDLRNNFWGTSNAGTIEAKVLHQPDDARRPLVLFVPFLDTPPAKLDPVITWPFPADIFVGTAIDGTQLIAAANTPGTFAYNPPAGAVLAAGNSQTLSVTFTPNSPLQFNSAVGTVQINVLRTDPVITWDNPANIVFGTLLGSTQLNATADVPGQFVYSRVAGTTLNAGFAQTLSVIFTPSDTANVNSIGATANINVLKADPIITWNTPAQIVHPLPLTRTQLSASAIPSGTFTYTPSLGTLLDAGTGQRLDVDFTPNDSTNFNNRSAFVLIDVLKGESVVTWNDPAPITVGTPLSALQLNATANFPGSFIYVPAAGTLLDEGTNQRLNVRFTPDDLNNFSEVTDLVRIDVARQIPVIIWDDPAAIVFGTPLGSSQLDATADVPGTFVYAPAAGFILEPGNAQTLSATFTPDDASTFATVVDNVAINVLKADPVITWADPADLTFGSPLSAVELNATANVFGSFQYNHLIGTVLDAGLAQTLTVTFTPDRPDRYNTAFDSAAIDVLKADPLISWGDPAAIIVGTPVGGAQLDAQADVPGAFTYAPALGTLLPPGDDQLLSVTFVPTDSNNFNLASDSVSIDVLDDLDYSDAPSSYLVALADDGPRHLLGSLFLGAAIDHDADGQPSANADGDDQDLEGDDEDGFRPIADLVTTSQAATMSSFLVTSSGIGKLDAWIDFDRNGVFDHPAEHLGGGSSIDVIPGDNVIEFAVPAGSEVGESFIRLRLSSAGGLLPSGPAFDGEVEDHALSIVGGNTIDVRVDAPDDQLTLARVSSDLAVQGSIDELFRAPANQVNSVQLTGTASDDSVTLDFEGGDLLPNGGLGVDGGDGDDTIRLLGADSDLDLTDPLISVNSVETFDLRDDSASVVTLDRQSVIESSPGGTLRVIGGGGDRLVFSDRTDWLMGDAFVAGGRFIRTVINGDAMVHADLPFAFQNLAQRHDVSNDGNIQASDALRVINELNARQFSNRATSDTVDPLSLDSLPDLYFDANGDGRITAVDALQIINELTRQAIGGGQPEQFLPFDLADIASSAEPIKVHVALLQDRSGDVSPPRSRARVDSVRLGDSNTPRREATPADPESPEIISDAVDQLLSQEPILQQIQSP